MARSFLFSLAALPLALLAPLTSQAAPPGGSPLLNVTQGQVPNDTGSDGGTKMTIEAAKVWEGKALKVVFAAGDSFGDRSARVKNWKAFTSLRFLVNNPGKEGVNLELNVSHKETTNFATRTIHPFEIKPGKNEVVIPMEELKNSDGSEPDLANVVRWYIAVLDDKSPTLYFSDLLLVGGKEAPPSDPAAAPVKLTGDPKRLARIRAAKMPAITKPIEFNTPEADAILSAMEVYPADNPWNLVVSDWPLHPRSKDMVASIGSDKVLRVNYDMNFIIVPPNQAKVPVKVFEGAEESDPGPFPVPANTPIEGYPRAEKDGKKLTLAEIHRRPKEYEDDRHAIVVDPGKMKLYEFYQLKKTDAGWQCACAAIFDLKSNKLRPDGWTSTDAAGLPLFPAIIRHDELQKGMVNHAMRVTVKNSRRAYVAPATHFASRKTDENLPRMGERLRLKADFDVTGFSKEVQAILKGLKKHGMLVADNGIEWALSSAPDERIPSLHEELRKVKGSAFEVVEMPAE